MKNKPFIFLTIFIIVLVLVIFASFLYLSLGKKAEQTPKSDFSDKQLPVGQREQLTAPASGQTYQYISATDEQKLKQDAVIAKLVTKLPYQGTSFSLSYSYADDIFMLKYTIQNKDQAELEFDQFLKNNGLSLNSLQEKISINGAAPLPQTDNNHGK